MLSIKSLRLIKLVMPLRPLTLYGLIVVRIKIKLYRSFLSPATEINSATHSPLW